MTDEMTDYGQHNYRNFNRGNKLLKTAREPFDVDDRQMLTVNATIDENFIVLLLHAYLLFPSDDYYSLRMLQTNQEQLFRKKSPSETNGQFSTQKIHITALISKVLTND
jgi:hypothetical protein